MRKKETGENEVSITNNGCPPHTSDTNRQLTATRQAGQKKRRFRRLRANGCSNSDAPSDTQLLRSMKGGREGTPANG